MILKTLINTLRCVWLGLELNSAGVARFEDALFVWTGRYKSSAKQPQDGSETLLSSNSQFSLHVLNPMVWFHRQGLA